MKLASVRFRHEVQHPEGVRAAREVVASDVVHLSTCDLGGGLGGLGGVMLHLPKSGAVRVYGPSAWESYDPAPQQVCSVCLKELPDGAQGETCSRSCAATLRHRRGK